KRLLLAKQREKAREEKLKADEAVRLAQEQAQLAKLEQEKQLEAQRKAQAATREAEEKRKAAELDAAKAQQQKAEREAALNDLFSELESETEQLSSARAKHVADEVSQWSSRYVVMIQQKWLIDPSMQGKKCQLSVRLAPDGLVLSVTLLSGDQVLCRSAKASVVNINKFPMPSGPEVVEKLRDIILNFQL
ncbi:MAG: cell envelope integrity protein TolA, partial [Enterovibrio sp.]